MKFTFTILLCLLLSFTSKSNVLYIDHSILEIYFNNGNWSVELFLEDGIGDENLEGLRMTGLYDTANFLPREFEWQEPFIVTQADFESPFYINQAGDWLFLEILIDNEWFPVDESGLNFGIMTDPEDTWVSAPVGDESVGWQLFYYNIPPWYSGLRWWTVKQLPNSLGIYPPWDTDTRAMFYGYVMDTNNYHVPDVRLVYCEPELVDESSPPLPELITDWNGYFYTTEMFCRKYKIDFMKNDLKIGETTVFIEPDSENFFVFRVDTLINRVIEPLEDYRITTVPNPSTYQATFIVNPVTQGPPRKGVIKIYNESGYMVDILPIEIIERKKELVYNYKDKPLQSGTYLYTLELERKAVASGKMIIIR